MRKRILTGCLLIVGLYLVVGCNQKSDNLYSDVPQAAGRMIIAGSGSNLPITGKLIEQYQSLSAEQIDLPNSIGTRGAIKAINEGAIELGLSSRLLNEEERAEDLQEIAYARVGIIIGVNTSVPDDNITGGELVEIFAGKKTTWTNGKMIVVLSREAGDSTNAVLEREVSGFAETLAQSIKENKWRVQYTDLEETEAITKTLYSIGFTDTGALAAQNLNIKPLKVNGIAPTIENVRQGAYRLYKDFYFVYKQPLSVRSQRFLEFVFSEKGVK